METGDTTDDNTRTEIREAISEILPGEYISILVWAIRLTSCFVNRRG